MKFKIIGLALLVGTLFVGSLSVFTVDEREQALVLQFGRPVGPIGHETTYVREAGLYFKMPWQDVRYFDKRVLSLDPRPENMLLSDQRRVSVDSYVRYEITDPLAFSQRLTNEIAAIGTLSGTVNNVLRGKLGNVTLPDLLSDERNKIMDEVQSDLETAVEEKGYGIEIIEFRLSGVDLPKENNEAIYNRMRTEREREAAEARAQGDEAARKIRAEAERERTVLLAEARRKSEIERGLGDEAAIKIYADAFSQDAEFYDFYRSMQAYREGLGKGDAMLILPPDSDFFDYFGNSTPRNQ